MIKRILAEAAIVAVQTAVLLGLAATVGVERGEHPIAAEALVERDQGGGHLHNGSFSATEAGERREKFKMATSQAVGPHLSPQ